MGPKDWDDESYSVELPEKRTANSKTYANPDGSRSAVVYAESVHAKTSKGWIDVDPTVTKKGNLLSSEGGSFVTTFAASDGTEPMVRLDLADGAGAISYSLVGATPTAKPAEKQNQVVWSGVKTDADFVVKQSAGQLKSAVVVKSPKAGYSFDFDLQLPPGWTITKEPKGGALLVNKDRTSQLKIPTPAAIDATGRTGEMKLNIGATDSGGKTRLTLAASSEWMRTAKYPVALDPSISATADPSYETLIDSNNNGSSGGVPLQNGGSPLMILGVQNAGTINRGFYRFPLPAGINPTWINDAQWQFRDNVPGTWSNNSQLRVEALTGWTGTWPTFNQAVNSSIAPMNKTFYTANQSLPWTYTSMTVTPMVASWYANPGTNSGFRAGVYTNGVEGGATFVTSTFATSPGGWSTLRITYEEPTVVPVSSPQSPLSVPTLSKRATRLGNGHTYVDLLFSASVGNPTAPIPIRGVKLTKLHWMGVPLRLVTHTNTHRSPFNVGTWVDILVAGRHSVPERNCNVRIFGCVHTYRLCQPFSI
jgi:hypothetical protein